METSASTASYRTHDLVTAVFLTCVGHRCEAVPSGEPGRAAFVFPKTDQLESDLSDFAKGEGRVSPTAYEYVKRDLLDRVRAVLQQKGRRRND